MISVAAVRSATGSANYFAADNYYTLEESEGVAEWFGEGAELLGLVAGDDELGDPSEQSQDANIGDPEPDAEQDLDAAAEAIDPEASGAQKDETGPADAISEKNDSASHLEDALPSLDSDDSPTADDTLGGDTRDGPAPVDSLTADLQSISEIADSVDLGAVDLEALHFDPVDESGSIAAQSNAIAGARTDVAQAKQFDNPTGKVDKATFEAILNGKLPDGTQVGEHGKRQLGMDMTFSMSKSASIVALIGGDKRVLEAHRESVKEAVKFAAANFAEARIKENGVAVPVRTGNLVTAMFEHDTSRALDPQSHIHVVIANMTWTKDGQWRALHNRELWNNKTVISSVYAAQFRAKVEALGYTTEQTGKHGTFEIVGVPKEVRQEFSQRRETILAKEAETGSTSFEARNKLTINTRDDKVAIEDRDALKRSWDERAEVMGFDAKAMVADAVARSKEPTTLVERGAAGLRHAFSDALERVASLTGPKDPLVDRSLMTSPADARTQVAVASALRILSQREAAFEVHQVTKTALDLGLRNVSHEGIAKRLTELIVRGEVVPGVNTRKDGVVTMITTKDAIATETAILREIETGKNSVAPLLKPDRAVDIIGRAAGDRELNPGQMSAAVSILSSNDRIVAVQGIAGAGKSTMLAAVANVLAFENKPAEGLAFQNKMVADLSEGTGLTSRTVASFVMANERHLAQPYGEAFRTAKAELQGSYRVLDEASMVSNDQMLKLVRIANVMEIEKLVLVGDRQQLLSIDAGKSFALLQAGGTATARMNINLRQRTPELRAVAALTNDGRSGDAIKLLGSNVVESKDRVAEASDRWLNLPASERTTTMLFTSGRETRTDLNRAIQSGLRAEGALKGPELTLTVLERVNGTREELRYAQTYTPGLVLEVKSDIPSVGLARGTYRVARQLKKTGRVELERNGKRQRFDPQKLPVNDKIDRLSLTSPKEVKIQEGERIRWTENDKRRDLLNSAIGTILGIDKSGITFERADKSIIRLDHGDPMLKRLDLAYTLNMHMAQGITTDRAIIVMGSEERFLANQRLFNVAVTRVRDGVTVITDNIDKLARQLDRNSGDKQSALEVAGGMRVDRQQSSAPKFDPGPVPDFARTPAADAPAKTPPAPDRAPQLPLPSKEKGLEL